MSVKSANEMRSGTRPFRKDGDALAGLAKALVDKPIVKTTKQQLHDTRIPIHASVLKEQSTPRDSQNNVLDSDWYNVDLISNFIFYDWSEISVRPFKPRDQAKLATAVKHNNMALLLDVISATSTKDARDLVFSDWMSLCILHKKFSYPDTPYNITWNSRYGVLATNTTKILKTEEVRLKADRKEYLRWKNEFGLVVPTCKDVELVTANMDDDTLYLFEKAQFIDPEPLADEIERLRKEGDRTPSLTARINKLDSLGLKHFDRIDEFNKVFSDFGIKERAVVEINEKQFNPEVAIAALRNFKSTNDDETIVNKETLEAHHEADLIEKLLAAAQIDAIPDQPITINYKPRKEEVPLAFSPWTMFPYT